MLGTINESGFQSARELLLQAVDYKRSQRAYSGNHEPPAQQTLL